MITLLLGYIYGVGFGLTIVGGVVYLLVMNGLKCHPSKIKMLLGLVGWPITWGVVSCKLYRVFREEFKK
jgi:hypothetical protein